MDTNKHEFQTTRAELPPKIWSGSCLFVSIRGFFCRDSLYPLNVYSISFQPSWL